jgi:hypothetical protein
MADHLKEQPPASASASAPGRRGHPLRTMAVDIVAPIALYYGIRAAGGSVWLALVAGGVVPAVSTLAGLLAGKRLDMTGVVMLAALAASGAFSLITGSPRALLARYGLVTAGWAGYMYLSLLARRPATFTVSRPLLEGRRVFDVTTGHWVRPADQSWDELWERLPGFRWIWRVCTVIWGTAILADAVIRVIVAVALPISVVPAVGGVLWPVTFILLQVATNIFFARSGFWRILRTGALYGAKRAVVVEFIKHRRQAYGEHLPADVAQEFRHEDPADAGKARVLVGEARAARMGLKPVGDLRHVTAFVADPRPAQQRRLIHLKDLAVDDAAPAGLRLRDEAELRAYDGGESFRPPAGAGSGPPRDERRVGHGPPDLRDGMGVVTHDADVAHGNSSG